MAQHERGSLVAGQQLHRRRDVLLQLGGEEQTVLLRVGLRGGLRACFHVSFCVGLGVGLCVGLLA